MARAALACVLGLFVSCASAPAKEIAPAPHAVVAAVVRPPQPPPAPRASRVVLVTIDGARWQEVFTGTDQALAAGAHVREQTASELMPTLSRWMTSDGVGLGAPGHGEIRASGPNFVSLPGYTEILSGRSPTGCQSNECDATVEPTFLDEASRAFGGSVAVVSSWESIQRAATDGAADFTLSTGRSYARGLPDSWLARGRGANPWPGQGDYRPDEETAPLALRVLRERRPRVAFFGLGDTDEHAHHGDYASYLGALAKADAFLASLEATLRETGDAATTTVLVTCDHGRSAAFRDHGGAFPESSRVWLVAHGAGVRRDGLVDSSRNGRLADVAPTARALLGMSADEDVRAGAPLADLLAR